MLVEQLSDNVNSHMQSVEQIDAFYLFFIYSLKGVSEIFFRINELEGTLRFIEIKKKK